MNGISCSDEKTAWIAFLTAANNTEASSRRASAAIVALLFPPLQARGIRERAATKLTAFTARGVGSSAAPSDHGEPRGMKLARRA
jgi:hypothetical protein